MTIISKEQDFSVELIHRDSDPSTWIVRRWRKVLWFKKRISSDWFNDERQAISFASGLRPTRSSASPDTSYGGKKDDSLIRIDSRGFNNPPQADDEGRWQDDGGEGG